MKLQVHQRQPRVEEIDLHFNPMTVFVTPNVELTIHRGDRLIDVVRAIEPHMKKWFDRRTLKKIVGYYFCMGERANRDGFMREWKPREYRAKSNRRYLHS